MADNKKKKSESGRSHFLGSAYSHGSRGPSMGMHLGGARGPPLLLQPRLEQTLSPPVCESIEESERIFKNSSDVYNPREKNLSLEFLEEVRSFVGSEDSRNPYTDTQIHKYLLSSGYEGVSRGDVILSRKKLGIRLPTLRKSE
jgi:hypothetical protein